MNWLEGLDSLAYSLIALVLGATGLIALAFIVADQFQWPHLSDIVVRISNVVADVLLVVVILEILGTVVHHLRDKETTLKPFLFIAIMMAVRGIISIETQLTSAGIRIPAGEFQTAAIGIGINTVVIIAVGITVRLLATTLEEGPNGRRKRTIATLDDDENDSLGGEGLEDL